MTVQVTGADLIARYDVETIGELATDDRTRLLRNEIPTHTNVLKALKAAQGETLARIRVGNRYSSEDLDKLDEYSLEHFKTVVCVIAMSRLFRRRPGIHAEMAKLVREEADGWLTRISKGEEVFALNDDTRHLDASVAEISGPTTIQTVNRNFMAARMAGHHVPDIRPRQPFNRR